MGKKVSQSLGVCLILLLAVGAAWAETREFLIVTGEWSWKAKAGEAPVRDRGRGDVREIERYTFAPSFLVVKKGDTVVLRIHTLKGASHLVAVTAFGVPGVKISRGEEKTIRFVADKAGVFEIVCDTHKSPETEGPMVAYLHVLD